MEYPAFHRPSCAVFFLVLLLALTGRAAAQEPPDEQVDRIVAYPEAKLLARYPGVARRAESQLDIMLAGGDYVRFEDTCPAGDNEGKCHNYELVNYSPKAKIAVLRVQYFEWHTAILIDVESARQFDSDHMPHISSDGRYLAVVESSLMNEEYIVQVIEHRSGGFALVANNLDDDSCQFKRWESNTAFIIVCLDKAGQYREKRVASGSNQRWSVRLTGKASSEEEFNRLANQSYDYE